jgi:hypothetical protein
VGKARGGGSLDPQAGRNHGEHRVDHGAIGVEPLALAGKTLITPAEKLGRPAVDRDLVRADTEEPTAAPEIAFQHRCRGRPQIGHRPRPDQEPVALRTHRQGSAVDSAVFLQDVLIADVEVGLGIAQPLGDLADVLSEMREAGESLPKPLLGRRFGSRMLVVAARRRGKTGGRRRDAEAGRQRVEQ